MKVPITGAAGIQARLAWVLGIFLSLVIVSAALTYMGLDAQRQDARVINLASRQRMLVQQMTRLSLEYEGEGEAHYRSDLAEAANTYDQTFKVLRYGGTLTDYAGQILVLPPPSDPEIIRALDGLIPAQQAFRAQIDRLLGAGAGAREVEALAPGVIDGEDRAVHAYEAAAGAKIARLHWIQLGFLAAGFLLVGAGWWLLRVSVVRPIRRLETAARRIREGDLESQVVISGPAEVVALGMEMEITREQLRASRRELQEWVDALERRVGQRTAELEALATVSREITSHLDIGAVLKSVTEKAQYLLGSEVAELCLLRPDGKQLNLYATAGPETALRRGTSLTSEVTTGLVLGGRAAQSCPAAACPGFCEILDPAYRASHLAAPVRLDDRVIGALCVGSRGPRAFGPDALVLLTRLAEAAAVALENARLYEQLERGATALERQRIASEMHDGLLQTHSFLSWMARLTEEQIAQGDLETAHSTLKKIERANAQAESEIRRAISSLHDDFPVRMTLQEQLAALAVEIAAASPAPQFENRVNVPIVLSGQDAEQVLRIAREALLNAQRYGDATQIRVCLSRENGGFVLLVHDDGRGFDLDCPPGDDRPHFGIKIMQARAVRLGGRLTIESAPGHGTRVTLRWSTEEQQP